MPLTRVVPKMIVQATARLLGRSSAGAGETEEIQVGSGLQLVSNVLSAAPVAGYTEIAPIGASVAGGALTVSLLPSKFDFRSNSLSNGTPVARDVASTINLVVPSGATLGTVSGRDARLALLAIDNAGVVELAIVNLAGGNRLDESNLVTTQAISASSNSSNVVYSAAARTNVAYRVIGLIDSNQSAAGTWAVLPSLVQGAGGNAARAMQSIGYGQTWQNLTASRAFATDYFNTTGRPIFVSVYAVASPTGGYIQALVDGLQIGIQGTAALASGVSAHTMTFIVPAGSTYRINDAGGGSTLTTWAELR